MLNPIEQLQAAVASLSRRVLELEGAMEERLEATPDQRQARVVAEEIGFSPLVIMLPKRAKERRELARELYWKRSWSQGRIVRALGCCERTVKRWVL